MLQRLKNKLTSSLFCSVNPDEVLSVTKDGRIILGGEQISKEEIRSLYSEVMAIRSCRIWNIVNDTLKADAMERAFDKSISYDDLKTAKMMLLNLDIIQKIFDKIEKEAKKK